MARHVPIRPIIPGLLCALLGGAACGAPDPLWAPPTGSAGATHAGAHADRPRFDGPALSTFGVEDRAYVVGHAFAVAVYGRALPRYLKGTGYRATLGLSASDARVAYSYAEVIQDPDAGGEGDDGCVVVEGVSGCVDGSADPLPEDGEIDEVVGEDGVPVAGGEQDAGADDCHCDGEIPTPEDPYLDDDCESFLDPAAAEARVLAARFPARSVLRQAGFRDADLTEPLLQAYARGTHEALALEDFGEETNGSEPEHQKEPSRDAGLCEHSPLVLDLDGDGIAASTPASGVLFDLMQSGDPVRTAWITGGDALLAMDRDGDGAIEDGGELFGNSVRTDGRRRSDGFAALAELDDNGDGAVDARDAAFTQLVMWRDADRDGVSAPMELLPLGVAGVTSLATAAQDGAGMRDAAGNALKQWGSFTFVEPSGRVQRGSMIDVWFRVQSAAVRVAWR